MSKKCCSTEEFDPNVTVTVSVDVPKIIKYLCVTGVLTVGIIFGTRTFLKMLEKGFFEIVE